MAGGGRGSVLVTGASSGIGTAVARAFLERGWRTVVAARRLDRLKPFTDDFPALAQACVMDVANPNSVKSALANLPEAWRDFEILVNNAGHDLGGRQRFHNGNIEDWTATVQTNLVGTMQVTYACIPPMIARKRGHIVNIGSILGLTANAGGSAYSASKFGVNGFSKALLEDYKGSGIRVSQIMPGVVKTEFAKARLRGDDAGAAKFYENFPAAMVPEDIARAVLFAVEQPPHVTISELVIVTSS